MSEQRIRHGTTDFAADPPRDMQYRNTQRCAWTGDGEQCETMIRKTSTHCGTHAAYLREMQKWESDNVAPLGMQLVCPPKMAQKWPGGVRKIFRAQWRAYWRRRDRQLIAEWWELTR